MDFDKRLQDAIARGERSRDDQDRADEAAALSEEDLRNHHSAARLELTEHIEQCLKSLADHFPGFRFQSTYGEDGWGARLNRDDFNPVPGSKNLLSRFEVLVGPFTDTHILRVTAKGMIDNREAINRSHFQFLTETDLPAFREQIDRWCLEYAERFASRK